MTDLLVDNDGNVDLAPGPSLLNHQRDVVLAGKGWHRFSPTAGADAVAFLNGVALNNQLAAQAKLECERIGLPPATAAIIDGQVVINTPAQ